MEKVELFRNYFEFKSLEIKSARRCLRDEEYACYMANKNKYGRGGLNRILKESKQLLGQVKEFGLTDKKPYKVIRIKDEMIIVGHFAGFDKLVPIISVKTGRTGSK